MSRRLRHPLISQVATPTNYHYYRVEAIRLGLSFLINWDEKMYYEPNDVPAIAR